MAFSNINIGAAPNDGTGDSLRVAGGVINANFAQAALDSVVVKLTGAQAIAGLKTFSTTPRGGTAPSNVADLCRKDYVDAQVVASGAGWDSEVTKTSDQDTTSTTVVDVSQLAIALASGHLYQFEAILAVRSTTTAGMALQMDYTGTDSGFSGNYHGVSNATGLVVDTGWSGAGFISGNFGTVANNISFATVRGIIITTGAGTLKVQFKKTTSGTARVFAGSKLRIRALT